MGSALRDDVQLSGAEGDVAGVHPDGQRAGEHEEDLVGLRVTVPGELTQGAYDANVVVVEDGDGPGFPRLVDPGENGGADLKQDRLLNTFDEWAIANGAGDAVDPPHRPEPTRVEASPPLGLDFARAGIRTIVWATGFRPDYSWLEVPVLDPKGHIRHEGGVVSEAPGLYVMGLPFLRRRKSSLIDGVGDDARDLSAHLASHLAAGSAGR